MVPLHFGSFDTNIKTLKLALSPGPGPDMQSDPHLEGQTCILSNQTTFSCISTNGVTRILEFPIPYTLY